MRTESIEDNIEEKREALLVLATLGLTKEYLGKEINIEKIYKLSKNGIEKYFNRYQLVQGKKVSDVLREKGIRFGVRTLSYFLPIIDPEKLIQDLEKDELVNRELTNIIGYLVLKGGRYVALASGIIQVANHIAIEPAQMLISEPSTDLRQSHKTFSGIVLEPGEVFDEVDTPHL